VGSSGDSFLIDMSTSSVAVGKIEMQMRKNERLPSLGWALGADGKPTTDAHEAFYKGAGKDDVMIMVMMSSGDENNFFPRPDASWRRRNQLRLQGVRLGHVCRAHLRPHVRLKVRPPGMTEPLKVFQGLKVSFRPKIRSWVKYEGKADLGHCFVAVDPECFAPGLADRLQARISNMKCHFLP
jgi:hypothetical protein